MRKKGIVAMRCVVGSAYAKQRMIAIQPPIR